MNRVLGLNDVFAIGDVAYMETEKYPKGHPQVANVAIGQGKRLAKNLQALIQGKTNFIHMNTGIWGLWQQLEEIRLLLIFLS